MFKTTYRGKHNLIGEKMKLLRKEKLPGFSQREFAEKLQLNGMDVDKNRISKIELGKSYVNDIELQIIARTLNVPVSALITEIPSTDDIYKTKTTGEKSVANESADKYTQNVK